MGQDFVKFCVHRTAQPSTWGYMPKGETPTCGHKVTGLRKDVCCKFCNRKKREKLNDLDLEGAQIERGVFIL